MNHSLLVIVFSLVASIVSSQELLTLQECLDKVNDNSLQTFIETGSLNRSKTNKQFHWWTLLPNLNANTGLNTSFGRRLDPFTNTFATSSVNSQSFGLNSSIQLFNGFSYFYKQNALNATIELDEISLDKKRNELKFQAIETYFALCKLSVQIGLAESRVQKYNQIQGLQRLLITEGRINAIDTLKSHNSILNEQNALLNLRNESKLKWIDLNFQMGLPLKTTHTVDFSSVSAVKERIQYREVYEIQQIERELELLENQLKAERSKLLPGISLNGLVGTGFSTNNKDYLLAGNPTKPYFNQINENLYEGIGFYLSIPIFNHGEWLKTKQLNAFQRAELTGKVELTNQLLEKQMLEREQKYINLRAQREQNKQLSDNLEIIYHKSVLLYKEGRLTYPELETVLIEWQMRQMEYELLKLDLEFLKIYE